MERFAVLPHTIVKHPVIRLVERYLFFFFQAEDGIRDLTVTGVQTCALPISCDLSPAMIVARTNDLMVVGASDNHGWGQVTCVWNVSRPGAQGFHTNRVFARPLALVQGNGWSWAAAVSQPWYMLRSLSWSERASWLTVAVIILLYRALPRREGQGAGLGILARSLGPRRKPAVPNETPT